MFSIEIKVNGVPVATVVAANERPTSDGFYEYSYTGVHFEDQKARPETFAGSVEWKRSAGIVGLTAMILEDANDQI